MFLLYDIFFIIFAVVYFPYVIIRRKWHKDFGMRFGFFSREIRQRLAGRKNIWIHAVSVGEVMAVKRFVEEIRRHYPDRQVVVSTVTTTGHDLAVKHFPEACVLYAPLDFSLSVCAYIQAIQPQCYIAAETEIWPNMFYFLDRYGIPAAQINGRISDKSYPGYKRFAFILKHVLSHGRCFCMQTATDAQRLIDIGADPDRVFITGNMKFDEDDQAAAQRYGKIFEPDDGPVLVAGSTHPGEEEIILTVFQRLTKKFPHVSLVLAPRHIERASAVERLIEEAGLPYVKFSQLSGSSVCARGSILLVDTIGHLKNLYAYASVVFMGKSLIGKGGQNIIEPALFGKPVIVGPHTENFRATVALFSKEEAVIVVPDQERLLQAVENLLDHPDRAQAIGDRAKSVIASQQGAVLNTFNHVQPLIPS